jgi:hypothetical protein
LARILLLRTRFRGVKCFFEGSHMRALGFSLMVVGLALIVGAVMLWPPVSRTNEEAEPPEEEAGDSADLLRRLPDDAA